MVRFKSLEERLLGIPETEARQKLVDALARRDYSVPWLEYGLMPQDKDELVSRINSYVGAGEHRWDKDHKYLYHRVSKGVLKRAYYGMACLRSKIPEELLSRLGYWEKICFFAGVWKKRSIAEGSLAEMAAAYIKAGYDALHKRHYIRKARGYCSSGLKLPGSQYYRMAEREKQRQDAKGKQMLLGIEKAIMQERLSHVISLLKMEMRLPSLEIAEKIAVCLDSCTEEELKFLRDKFGSSAVGGYERFITQPQ